MDKIIDNLDSIEDDVGLNVKLTKKLIRRAEVLIEAQNLTNNILINMARAESKEDLNNRLDMLLAIEEV